MKYQLKKLRKNTESFHLEGVDGKITSTYKEIKNEMTKIDPAIKVNPRKYYIARAKLSYLGS